MNPIVLVGLIVMAIHFLQAGRKRATLPGAEKAMTTTIEFITALFYEVDEQMGVIPKHPEAGIVKLLGMIVSPGNSRRFPGAMSTDPTLRQPAPYP
jgi:hypothetical protein